MIAARTIKPMPTISTASPILSSKTEEWFHEPCGTSLSEQFKGKWSTSYARPKNIREGTHYCPCGDWKLTLKGWRIWRQGSWRSPKPGELRKA